MNRQCWNRIVAQVSLSSKVVDWGTILCTTPRKAADCEYWNHNKEKQFTMEAPKSREAMY